MIKYEFEQINYEYEIKDNKIIQKVNLADLKTKDLDKLSLITLSNRYLIDVNLEIKQDYLIMESDCPINYQRLETSKNMMDSQKIQILLNLAKIESFEDEVTGTILHPNNLILDYNLEPQFLYRGLKGYMPVQKITEQILLDFVKLCAGVLYTKYKFDELKEGLLEKSAIKNYLLEKLIAINSLDEVKLYLSAELSKVKKKENKNYVIIKRGRYLIWKQCAIWFGVVSILALIPLGIFSLKIIPHDKSFLEADTQYIQDKYNGVIKSLEDIKLEDLPITQKYELAISYIEGSGFDNNQRENIMHNLNLRSKSEYLDFWIQIGRGDFEDALNTAKNLEDSNLIKYALLKNMEAVRQNKKLKPDKKQEIIDKLSSEYEKLEKEGEDK